MTQFIVDVLTRLLEYPYLFAALAFILGTMIGSFLNVCIYRLPLEKSILWPGSHCGSCHKAIGRLDNIPLISYLWLHGKCRHCGAKFSPRYFWIELLTGVVFAGLFWLEVRWNMLGIGGLPLTPLPRSMQLQVLWIWLYHCFFFCFLIVAFFTDVDHQEIPYQITVPGIIVGVLGGVLFPWPWPLEPGQIIPPSLVEFVRFGGLWTRVEDIVQLPGGLQRWPVWMPVPDWLPDWLAPTPGTWKMGLATSAVGAAVGWVSFWIIRVVFGWGLGKESMGLGDADLMAMIGAFLGWQMLFFVFVLALPISLLYVVLLLLRNKGNELPFGPFLALGAMLTTVLSWWLGTSMQQAFFDGLLIVRLLMLTSVMGLFVILVLRMFRLIGQAA